MHTAFTTFHVNACDARADGHPLPRAPHLARAEDDVDPTRLHLLGQEDFWRAFFGRYGRNAHLVRMRARACEHAHSRRAWAAAGRQAGCQAYAWTKRGGGGGGAAGAKCPGIACTLIPAGPYFPISNKVCHVPGTGRSSVQRSGV